ncbi:response regulator [Solirubrobacter phytolaccae]|uniref:Response regulator n=1 Tax=Solirubrobacter phytolaccae TaxID=1404360 RepID=A0A9X3N6Y1_9ACTN|nr:response regulator [Solirubrobacter phytolaccae]MDA0180616.1 response regulator [Solirubrobacter phytolaccae]
MSLAVLVVDDHPAVALALRLYFRRLGRFAVAASAGTATDGLRALESRPFDAVLLDLHLPDLSGVELVRAFRAAAPDTPLILHSAADETADVEAVRGLVDAVTLKSDVPAVLAALERLTDGGPYRGPGS